jgi:hypothetical protein
VENEDEVVKSTERSTYDMVIRNTFQKYFQAWMEETQYLSSTQAMFGNKNYQEIINMGWDVVPVIIEQLRKKPEHLFKALKCITGLTPIKPNHAGYLYEMAADWIEWYDNVYLSSKNKNKKRLG